MNASKNVLPELLLTAALALILGLAACCLFDAAFIFAFGETKLYPRRFPAETVIAAVSLPAALLCALPVIRRRKGRGAPLFIAAGVLLAFPAIYLWEFALSLL